MPSGGKGDGEAAALRSFVLQGSVSTVEYQFPAEFRPVLFQCEFLHTILLPVRQLLLKQDPAVLVFLSTFRSDLRQHLMFRLHESYFQNAAR